jgi:Ribosomal proteins 50S-L15, 50S-L18e, 60S-L27A
VTAHPDHREAKKPAQELAHASVASGQGEVASLLSLQLISAFLAVQGSQRLRAPVHLQVSQASAAARSAVEAAGGSVTTVYYNKLGAPLGGHGTSTCLVVGFAEQLAHLWHVVM